MPKATKIIPSYISAEAQKLFQTIDFSDTYATTNHSQTVEQLAHTIFNTPAAWIKSLLAVRNSVVKLFGLKTGIPDDYHTRYEVGGYISFFKIYSISEDELIMGLDDSHLNFRAIISLTDTETDNIKVTTLVQHNNKFGKAYMTIVKPFHGWTVKSMVSKAHIDYV